MSITPEVSPLPKLFMSSRLLALSMILPPRRLTFSVTNSGGEKFKIVLTLLYLLLVLPKVVLVLLYLFLQVVDLICPLRIKNQIRFCDLRCPFWGLIARNCRLPVNLLGHFPLLVCKVFNGTFQSLKTGD
jgi:hypothetical protein